MQRSLIVLVARASLIAGLLMLVLGALGMYVQARSGMLGYTEPLSWTGVRAAVRVTPWTWEWLKGFGLTDLGMVGPSVFFCWRSTHSSRCRLVHAPVWNAVLALQILVGIWAGLGIARYAQRDATFDGEFLGEAQIGFAGYFLLACSSLGSQLATHAAREA